MCRLRTPLRTPSPGAAPTAPVALARCRWQLGASSHTCALLGLTCSNTLHVIPHEVLLPKQRLSHSQEMGGKPGGQQRMGRERRRGPAAATQPLGMERWHLEQPHTRGTLQPDGDEHLPGGRCMSKELQGLRGGGCCSREGDPGTNPASFHRSAQPSGLKHRHFITPRQPQAGFSLSVPLFVRLSGRAAEHGEAWSPLPHVGGTFCPLWL